MCQQTKIPGKKRITACLNALSRPVFIMLPAAVPVMLFVSGCSLRANEKYVRPDSSDVSSWRQYLGVAVAIQLLLMATVFWNTDRRRKLSHLLLALFLMPLVWTAIGEWIYRLGDWLLDKGQFGKLLAIIISLAGGIQGSFNVYSYLLGGVVFNDTDFLLYWSLPGVAASYVLAAVFMLKGRRRERE